MTDTLMIAGLCLVCSTPLIWVHYSVPRSWRKANAAEYRRRLAKRERDAQQGGAK
jgi:hypothetical protein